MSTSTPRTVSVDLLANVDQFTKQFERAGLVVEDTTAKIRGSAKAAGDAAAAQAKAMGASSDAQAAAAGRAAAAFVDAQAKISTAAKAAGDAAARSARDVGASVEVQRAAYTKAIATQTAFEDSVKRAADAAKAAAAEQSAAVRAAADAAKEAAVQQAAAAKAAADAQEAAAKRVAALRGAGASVASKGATVVADTAGVASKGGGVLSGVAGIGPAGAAAAGFAATAFAATDMAAKYQQAVNRIAGASDIPIKAAQQIGNAFLDTAGKSIFSGKEMADAFVPVAGQLKITEGSALNAAQALKVMNAAGDLAEATGDTLGSSTAALATVMQGYHLKVTDAAHATDVLFNSSRALNQPVETIAQAMNRLHGRLGDLAPSMQDVGGLMVEIGAHGIQGSRGVSVMNTALQTLVGHSSSVTQVLQDVGVKIFNQQGKFIGLQNVIAQLQPKFAQMNQEQQDLAAKTLFGSSAAQVMLGVIKQGPAAFEADANAAGKAGSAHQAAADQSETLSKKLDILKASAEDLATKLGNYLVPLATDAANAVVSAINLIETHWSQMVRGLEIEANALKAGVDDAMNGIITVIDKVIGAIDKLIAAYNKIPLLPNVGAVGQVGKVGTNPFFNTADTGPHTAGMDLAGGATTFSGTARAQSSYTPSSFAAAAMSKLGITPTPANIKDFTAWEAQEGGNWANKAKFNPLNTTQIPASGLYSNTGSQGNIKAYTSWAQGLTATVATLKNYAGILAALRGNASPGVFSGAVQNATFKNTKSHWGTGAISAAGQSLSQSEVDKILTSLGFTKNTSGVTTGAGTSAASMAANTAAAPAGVAAMLATAQALLRTKYTHGGGHGATFDSVAELKKIGIDCSAFVSKVLSAGGVSLPGPLTTTGLAQNLTPGKGKQGVTVYDRATGPYGNQHALIDILGKYFMSGGSKSINPTSEVVELTPAQARQELAGGGFKAYHPGSIAGGLDANGINLKNVLAKLPGATTPLAKGAVSSSIKSAIVQFSDAAKIARAGGQDRIAALDTHSVAELKALGAKLDPKAAAAKNQSQLDALTKTVSSKLDKIQTQNTIGSTRLGQASSLSSSATGAGSSIGQAIQQFSDAEKVAKAGGQERIAELDKHTVAQLVALGVRLDPKIAAAKTQSQLTVLTGIVSAALDKITTGNSVGAAAFGRTTSSADASQQQGIYRADAEIKAQGVRTTANDKSLAAIRAAQKKAAAAVVKSADAAQQQGILTANAEIKAMNARTVANNKVLSAQKTLEKSARTLIGQFQSADQSGGIGSLQRRLGYSSSRADGGSVAKGLGGQANSRYENDLKALIKDGQTKEAAALVAAHKQAMATLAMEMVSQQKEHDAQELQQQTTTLNDQTTAVQNAAQSAQTIDQATQQKVNDMASAVVQHMADMQQITDDTMTGMATAINDRSTLNTDTGQGVIDAINDSTQTEVDTIGEKGLFGAQLVAQKLQVEADQTKAFWDQQIDIDKQQLDLLQLQADQAETVAQVNLDQVTMLQNANVAQAQNNLDTVTIAQDQLIGNAQAHADAVQLSADTTLIGPAQIALDMNANSSSSVQGKFQAQLDKATAAGGLQTAQANNALANINSTATQAIQAATDGFNNVSNTAANLIQQATDGYKNTTDYFTVQLANASSNLQSDTTAGGIAEASATGNVNVAQANASTQFAGSGLVVNLYGVPTENAAGIGQEVSWAVRTSGLQTA